MAHLFSGNESEQNAHLENCFAEEISGKNTQWQSTKREKYKASYQILF